MAFLLPPPIPACPTDGWNWTIIKAGVSAGTTSKTATVSTAGRAEVVLVGVDMTVTGGGPSQWYAEAKLSGAGNPFFHDSQSTGEGLGISFYWRGMLRIDDLETLTLNLTNISGTTPLSLGFYASAFYRPIVPQLP